MTSSDITSPFNRTIQMKADELNYRSVNFHGDSITSLGFRGHSFDGSDCKIFRKKRKTVLSSERTVFPKDFAIFARKNALLTM